jgi:large subunit ribosomal protein L30
MAKKLEIELVKSVIACPRWMRTIVRTLGLRKLHSKSVLPDNGSTWGMIKKVPHLVSVKAIEE